MKKIFLTRHGETLFNVLGRTQGQCDSPLTNIGITMAKKLGEYFKANHIVFDYAYTSTSERAEDTLLYIAENTEYARLKSLKEIHFGQLEGGEDRFIWQRHPNLNINTYDKCLGQYGLEKMDDAFERFHEALKDIAQKEYDTILVVSHGLVISNWANHLGKEFFEKYNVMKKNDTLVMGNCDCLVLEYVDDAFQIKDYIVFNEIDEK